MPEPVIVHQTACVASGKPIPLARPAATIAPLTATPRAEPIALLVEAIAAATPNWLIGIPDIATVEMAGLTMPRGSGHSVPPGASCLSGVA